MPPGVEEGDAIYVGTRPNSQASRIADQAVADIDAREAANNNRWVVSIGQAVIIDSGAHGLDHWEDPGDPWDVLVIAGKPMPGIWEIESCERRHKVDRKKSSKKDGANVTDLGRQPAKITARGQLYSKPDGRRRADEPNHWAELQRRLEEINPRMPGKQRAPFTVYHPATALMGISVVMLECVRSPRIRDGILELGLELVEYQPPKATKTAKTPRSDPKNPVSEQFAANMRATPSEQLYGYGVAGGARYRAGLPAGTGDRSDPNYAAQVNKPVDWMDESEKRSLVSRPSNSQVQPSQYSSGSIRDAFRNAFR